MDSIEERLQRARELIAQGTHFRILTHYDVDGVCSGSIVADYLRGLGKDFHISFFRNSSKDALIDAINGEDFVILTDMGSGLVNDLDGNVIVLDHHNPQGRDNKKIVHINPHLFGYDGAIDATATTMAYLLANNKKYIRCLLAGILGDKQYIHAKGPVGLNKKILDSLDIKAYVDLTLHGTALDALLYSIEPFYPGITGKIENVEDALEKLKISKTINIEKMKMEEKLRLGSYLALNLIKNSKIPDGGKMIVNIDFDVGGSVRYFTDLIDAACRTDNQSIAMAHVLGGDGYLEKMEVLLRDFRGKIIEEMYTVLANVFEMEHIQYFYAKSPYLGSTLSTLTTLYLFDPKKVTLSFHIGDEIEISAREHRNLTNKVNLGVIMHKVAMALGGEGGGHNVAAGATIPHGTDKEFIQMVNKEIEKSLSQ